MRSFLVTVAEGVKKLAGATDFVIKDIIRNRASGYCRTDYITEKFNIAKTSSYSLAPKLIQNLLQQESENFLRTLSLVKETVSVTEFRQ